MVASKGRPLIKGTGCELSDWSDAVAGDNNHLRIYSMWSYYNGTGIVVKMLVNICENAQTFLDWVTARYSCI